MPAMHLFLGLFIWGVWFVFMYGALSVACVVTEDKSYWINFALLSGTLVTVVLLIVLAHRTWQQLKENQGKKTFRYFILWLSTSIYLAAASGTISIGIMVLFFPPCV